MMMKSIAFGMFALLLASGCGQSEKKESNLPLGQQRIAQKMLEEQKKYDRAGNNMQKEEVQNNFNRWLHSYLKDTLKGKIEGFVLEASDVNSGKGNGFYFALARFRTEDGLRFYREIDLPTKEEIQATTLYKNILNVTKGSKVKVTATYDTLRGYDHYDNMGIEIPFRCPSIAMDIDTILPAK